MSLSREFTIFSLSLIVFHMDHCGKIYSLDCGARIFYKLAKSSANPLFLSSREMLCPQYIYNKSCVIGCYWLLWVEQKSNLSCEFKLEPITIYQL